MKRSIDATGLACPEPVILCRKALIDPGRREGGSSGAAGTAEEVTEIEIIVETSLRARTSFASCGLRARPVRPLSAGGRST